MPSGWSLPEPMRAEPVNDPALPAGWAAQPEWDGYRALAGRWADGRVTVRSRNDSNLAQAFPEIEEAVRRVPDETAIDYEGGLAHPLAVLRQPLGLPLALAFRCSSRRRRWSLSH
ncbi:hypothetical protein OG381_46470 [Streptomyces sp. NBC_00490]|uniref:hypothetical protein n=1 Tax=Streptomyces sp. NBC_00490 TaxID=2903657 RepID=UPI002E19AD4F